MVVVLKAATVGTSFDSGQSVWVLRSEQKNSISFFSFSLVETDVFRRCKRDFFNSICIYGRGIMFV